jgi:hypothetical protein
MFRGGRGKKSDSACGVKCLACLIQLAEIELGDFTYLLTYLLSYLLTHSLTHSMVQDIIWKVDCHSACQKVFCFLMEPEGSLTCSHKPATGPYPKPAESRSSHRSLSP